MKLARKSDKVFIIMSLFIVVFVATFILIRNTGHTFARSEDGVFFESEEHFVNFFDNGKKLIVKTKAQTVGEALSKAHFDLSDGDIVEPALETTINSDNFFINIYRARPVVVKDGNVSKYFMTASYDAKSIAREAGFTVYDGDEVLASPNKNFLEAGATSHYEITRNGGREITEEVEIPFEEETVKDYNMKPGEREIRQLGEVGMKHEVYKVFYVDNEEVSREFISEEVVREPVTRIVAVGASAIEKRPLTPRAGRNRYTVTRADGVVIERQETFYDLPMSGVMAIAARECGVENYYEVRDDGVKVDAEGYVLVAADLSRYPRCSVVETSLGLGRVYDTGTFVESNPEQFDLATDWTNRNGR